MRLESLTREIRCWQIKFVRRNAQAAERPSRTLSAALPPLLLLMLAGGGLGAALVPPVPAGQKVDPGVLLVGRIAPPRLTESSGLVASRRHAGVFWTHNDGGGGRRQVLYAITREGKALGEWLVAGATLVDWEDLAIGAGGKLYVGDVGNNEGRRRELAVYELDEPDPHASGVCRVNRRWQLRYPAAPFNCEALFVWQSQGYLVSKLVNDARARMYRFSLSKPEEPQVIEEVAILRVESPVTGAALSADGSMLALVAKAGAYVFPIKGDPLRAGSVKPYRAKFKLAQIEGCSFVPEGLLATAETREIFLFTDEPFRPRQANGKTP
jgi:hypothetical protein